MRINARDVYGRKCYLNLIYRQTHSGQPFLVSKNGWLKQAFLGSVVRCLYYFRCQCSGQVVGSCHIFVVTKAALARFCFLFVVTWYCIHCFGFVWGIRDVSFFFFYSCLYLSIMDIRSFLFSTLSKVSGILILFCFYCRADACSGVTSCSTRAQKVV